MSFVFLYYFYCMTLKLIIITVVKSAVSPIKKIISAIRSYSKLFSFNVLMEKKEKIQLAIKKMVAIAAMSSIIVVADNFRIFREVITIKQIPKRLLAAFKTCGDVCFCSFMIFLLCYNCDFFKWR